MTWHDEMLAEQISAVLRRHDPAGVGPQAPRDEYRPEALDLAPMLGECSDVDALAAGVREVLLHWFGSQTPPATCAAVARDLWPLGERSAVLQRLARLVDGVRPGQRALVGVDGFDGVGKTHMVGELAELLNRPAVVASIDGFHRPRAERRAAGTGAGGFYHGSYRYEVFRAAVVDPLRRGEPVVPAVWDVARDEPVHRVPVVVPDGSVVLVDGIFLQRPEIADVWDAVVWVDAPFAVTVPRGNARFPGDHDADPEAASNARYVGGQRLYMAEADPCSNATWVLDNSRLDRPMLRGPATSSVVRNGV